MKQKLHQLLFFFREKEEIGRITGYSTVSFGRIVWSRKQKHSIFIKYGPIFGGKTLKIEVPVVSIDVLFFALKITSYLTPSDIIIFLGASNIQSNFASTWDVNITLKLSWGLEILVLSSNLIDCSLKPWKPVRLQNILYKGTEK